MKTWPLTLILAGLAMTGPFATDTYLPSFAVLAQHFGVGPMAVQQTLSVYLFAYAFMTLLYGTLSDSFGRRPVILGALMLFAGASLGASLADSFSQLLLFRGLQGLSAGAGMVIGQAIVRDRLQGAEAQRMIAHIMMVFGIAPAIAPVIGGYLQVALGWRAVFGFMVCIALVLLIACARCLPESLPVSARHPFALRPIARNYAAAIGHAAFLLRSVAIGALFGSFALYVASAANFVMQILHLPATAFAWLFVPMIGGFVGGSALSARLAHRHSGAQMIRGGFAVMTLAALANLAYCWWFTASVPWVMLPIFIYTFGLALALPAMSVMTLGIFPAMRGLAASLQNFVQMTIFALVSAFIAPLLFGSAFKLACGMATGMVISFVCWRRALSPAQTTPADIEADDRSGKIAR